MSPSPRTGWQSRGPLVVTVLTLVALGAYFALDHRLPRDPGLYWADLPRTYRALGGQRWGMVGQILGRPGGWLLLCTALLARLSRGVWVMELLSIVSVGTVVACAGVLGTRVGAATGPDRARWGGWLGALLAAGMPLVVVQGRLPWIHLPEAALLGVVMVVLTGDPALTRTRSWVVAGVAGALLASVRHSGLVWLITVLPLLQGRSWLLLVPWGVGAFPSVAAMAPYLLAKADARAGYAERLPGLLPQAWRMLGPAALVVAGLGGVQRLRDRAVDRLLVAGGSQLLVAGLLFVVFRAGLDNFTPLVLGLVVVAAASASRVTAFMAAAGFVWVWTTTFVPLGPPDFRTLHTRWPAPEVRAIRQLVRASCVDGPCRVGTDSGLFMPHGEEPGRLELWLLGADQLQLVDLRTGARALTELPVAAVAEWDCGEDGQDWLDRFPQSREWQRVGKQQLGLQRAWVFRPDDQCALVWWTPGGQLVGTRPRLGKPPRRAGG